MTMEPCIYIYKGLHNNHAVLLMLTVQETRTPKHNDCDNMNNLIGWLEHANMAATTNPNNSESNY